jgi:hypothetical protein
VEVIFHFQEVFMAVKQHLTYVLRGRVRAQTREAIGVGQRLLNAAALNPNLYLFAAGIGPGSATSFEQHMQLWRQALATKA